MEKGFNKKSRPFRGGLSYDVCFTELLSPATVRGWGAERGASPVTSATTHLGYDVLQVDDGLIVNVASEVSLKAVQLAQNDAMRFLQVAAALTYLKRKLRYLSLLRQSIVLVLQVQQVEVTLVLSV